MSRPSIPSHFRILGTPVSVVTMHTALTFLSTWVQQKTSAYVCVSDVNSLMHTLKDADHLASFEQASMVTPDGRPLSLVARLRGCKDMGRVSGPDLLPAVCSLPEAKTWRHYFYGSSPETLERLIQNLKDTYPHLNIVGYESPPFRPLTPEETAETHTRLKAAAPDIIWVGLGAPKQERWMRDNSPHLPGMVLIGIGAAFDFHAGTVKRAPLWMQKLCLEWLHRLYSEPKRLWRRYLITAPHFVWLCLKESFGKAS